MINLIKKFKIVIISILLLGAALAPLASFAQENNALNQARTRAQELSQNVDGRNEDAETRAQEFIEVAERQRSEAQIRTCENRQTAVQRRMQRLVALGERQVQVFNTIFERVQNFYREKGLGIEDYEALVADSEEKKANVEFLLQALRENGQEFNCADDPRVLIGDFRSTLHSLIEALKEYRTSIKDLIVVVKIAADNKEAEAERQAEDEEEQTSGEDDE